MMKDNSVPQKDSDILREVKKRIKSGKDDFICCALDASTELTFEVHPLQKWINRMLDGNYTLDGWLSVRELSHTPDAARVARLQWLDWMIAYCESEEEYGKVLSFDIFPNDFVFHCINGKGNVVWRDNK